MLESTKQIFVLFCDKQFGKSKQHEYENIYFTFEKKNLKSKVPFQAGIFKTQGCQTFTHDT